MPFPRLAASANAFRLFWSSQIVSLMAMQFGIVTIPLLVIHEMNGTSTQVIALTAVAAMPWIFFGAVTGEWIDRWVTKYVIVAVHVFRTLTLSTLVLLSMIGWLSIWLVYLAVFLMGCMSMVFDISRRTFLPAIVSGPTLTSANSKLAISDSLTRVLGPSFAGKAVSLLSIVPSIMLQACLFGLAGILSGRVPVPELPTSDRTKTARVTVKRHKHAGFVGVLESKPIRALAVSEALYMFGFSLVQSVIMLIYSRELEMSPSQVGLIFSAGSVGGVIAAFSVERIVAGKKRHVVLRWSSLIRSFGICVNLVPFLFPGAAFWLFMIARVVSSMGWTYWQVSEETTMQQIIAPDQRGSMNGFVLFIVRGAEALGGFSGIILSLYIMPRGIMTVGTTMTLMALLPLLSVTWKKSLSASLLENNEPASSESAG